MDATRTYYLKGLDSDQIIALIGENDSHLKLLSSLYHTDQSPVMPGEHDQGKYHCEEACFRAVEDTCENSK